MILKRKCIPVLKIPGDQNVTPYERFVLWPISNSNLYLGKNTIDRLFVAANNLESLFPGPSKHDHSFLAQRKPETVSWDLSNPKPGHTTDGTGQGGAWRDGGAGRGGAGWNADGPVRPGDDRPSHPPDYCRKLPWACPQKHEQRNPMQTDGGTKRPVDPRFIRGTTAALCTWLLTSVPSAKCPCKPFFMRRACPTMEVFLCQAVPTRGGSFHGGSGEDTLDTHMRLPPKRVHE